MCLHFGQRPPQWSRQRRFPAHQAAAGALDGSVELVAHPPLAAGVDGVRWGGEGWVGLPLLKLCASAANRTASEAASGSRQARGGGLPALILSRAQASGSLRRRHAPEKLLVGLGGHLEGARGAGALQPCGQRGAETERRRAEQA
jgi:hypothetical protein